MAVWISRNNVTKDVIRDGWVDEDQDDDRYRECHHEYE